MTKCVAGRWEASLDDDDRAAFYRSLGRISRAELYGHICAAEGRKPFGLTALKDCLNGRCICDGEPS